MGLVRDDQIEETGVERLEALHHSRVGGQVDAVFALLEGARRNVDSRHIGQEPLERVVRLLSQLSAIAKEQDTFHPSGTVQGVADRDGDASLSGARGLHEQGFLLPLLETL